MKVFFSFFGKHKYHHSPDTLREKIESLVKERFSDLFLISDVWLALMQNENEDTSHHHTYTINFDCRLNRSDLEDDKHVQMLDDFIKDKFNDILDSKKKFTFTQLTIAPNISSPAIEIVTDKRVSIDRLFAEVCAKDLKYCRTILQSNVVEINFEYEQKSTGVGCATGKNNMKLSDEGKASFERANPYHAFAAAILNYADLRKLLTANNIQHIEMEKDDNGELMFTIKTSVGVMQTSALKNRSPEASVVPSSVFARQPAVAKEDLNFAVAPTGSLF